MTSTPQPHRLGMFRVNPKTADLKPARQTSANQPALGFAGVGPQETVTWPAA
jgi:hypothetical protein